MLTPEQYTYYYDVETANRDSIMTANVIERFDIAGTPFGKANFDAVQTGGSTDFLYEEMFAGLVFYKPLDERHLITGWEDFTTDDFMPERRRRWAVYGTSQGMDPAEIERRLWEDNEVEISPPELAIK